MELVQEMLSYAEAAYPHECCGLVVASSGGKRPRLTPANNLAKNPRTTFDLDPEVWLGVGDDEEVIGVYHSHPDGTPDPSPSDLSACEEMGILWHIVSWPGCGHTTVAPTGYEAPYVGRAYVHGTHDCYAVIRDWYARELEVTLPNPYRQDAWWDKGEDLYLDNYAVAGFDRLAADTPPSHGDVLLIQYSSRVPNHAAVYLQDGTILHHAQGRLSCLAPYGGFWEKHTVAVLRHNRNIGGIANG